VKISKLHSEAEGRGHDSPGPIYMSEFVSSSCHKGVGRGNGSSIPKAAFVDLIAREMAAVPGPGAYTIVRDGDPIHLRPATATGDGRDVSARAKPVHTLLRTKGFSLTSKPRGLLPAKREDFAPRGDHRIKSRPQTMYCACCLRAAYYAFFLPAGTTLAQFLCFGRDLERY